MARRPLIPARTLRRALAVGAAALLLGACSTVRPWTRTAA